MHQPVRQDSGVLTNSDVSMLGKYIFFPLDKGKRLGQLLAQTTEQILQCAKADPQMV